MPVQVSWAVENRIILIEASGVFTTDEMRQMDVQIVEHLRSVAPSTVHMVGTMTQLRSMPPLSEMLRLQGKNEPNLGWMVVVGQRSAINRTIVELFARLANKRLRNAATIEEALEFLEQQPDPVQRQ